MSNPSEGEYRSKIRRYIDDVFHEMLDEPLAMESVDEGRKTTAVGIELLGDASWLSNKLGPPSAHQPLCTPPISGAPHDDPLTQNDKYLGHQGCYNYIVWF